MLDGAIFILSFLLGALMMRRLLDDLREERREDLEYLFRKIEACRMAGYRREGDPKPYVAPPARRRRRGLPCSDRIEEAWRNGKRFTVICRKEDNR